MQSKVPNDVEFKIPLINIGFVRNVLSNLNVNKSTGLDNIGPKILKISANIIAPSHMYIIKKAFVSDYFQIYKKKQRSNHCSKVDIRMTLTIIDLFQFFLQFLNSLRNWSILISHCC